MGSTKYGRQGENVILTFIPRKIPVKILIECAGYVHPNNFVMENLEITSGIVGFVGICVGVVVVQIIVIFEIQIPRYWVYHPFDPIMRPSKFRS